MCAYKSPLAEWAPFIVSEYFNTPLQERYLILEGKQMCQCDSEGSNRTSAKSRSPRHNSTGCWTGKAEEDLVKLKRDFPLQCMCVPVSVKSGSQKFEVWVPSVADVTLVLLNMGASFATLFPLEKIQPPFSEGDLLWVATSLITCWPCVEASLVS